MNSETSKTSRSHSLLLRFTNKMNLGRGEESVALPNLSIYDNLLIKIYINEIENRITFKIK